MIVKLAYGSGFLSVDFPEAETTVIEPYHTPPLPDERAALIGALEGPINARPLRDWIIPDAKICVSFSDISRATPNERIIPWLLEYLAEIPRENFTLINQTGTHRPRERGVAPPGRLHPQWHSRTAEPSRRRGRCPHRNRIHRATFFRRLQRRAERHHAGHGGP